MTERTAYRQKAIERLACDICWAGFAVAKHAGCTKLEYWARVTESAKQDYRAQAGQLLSLVRRLGIKRIETALSATEVKS